MKALVLTTILAALASTAQAGTLKTCTGVGEAKGETLTVDVSVAQIVVLDGENPGSFKYRSVVHGRDGYDYFEYFVPTDEYDSAILANENLTKPGTVGLMKIRSRGETFFQSTYICRDKQN